MSGAFQTSREIFDHPIWKNIVEFRLFFLIVGKAVFSEKGVKVAEDLTLQRGQFLRSTRKLQEDLQYIENRQVKTYSTSTINRTIKKLVAMQRLCTKEHELGTVFTVVNYEQYQGFSYYQGKEHGTQLGTVIEQPSNNNKKDIKVEKCEKIKYHSEFESFWSVYPRKVRKQETLPVWDKLLKQGIDPEEVIRCTKAYAEECNRKKTEAAYIMHPSTFLNKDRWRDYHQKKSKPSNLDIQIAFQRHVDSGGDPAAFKYSPEAS